MKIILAPDKYKSCMDASTVCRLLNEAILTEIPDAEVVSLPMADGGDGTVRAILAATDGELKTKRVSGPFGDPVDAHYGLYRNGSHAVIEMAEASGIALIDRSRLDPMKATTFGTGEVLRAAIADGAREILIGIGGSATIDGGAGMAQALGFRLLDRAGAVLPVGIGGGKLCEVSAIDDSEVMPELKAVRVRVACDVTSPLLGKTGSVSVFGPQKGTTAETAPLLEAGLANLREVWYRQNMLTEDKPGDGAAGGLGAGLRAFCKAEPESGAQLVMQALDFEKNLRNADLVITGEGCTDGQTDAGKLCGEIAKSAHAHGVPVLLLSGSLRGKLDSFFDAFDYVFSISSGHISLDSALAGGQDDLKFFMRNLGKLMKFGRNALK